eukprot:COSAG02_NODE_14657_length_1250_cov_8.830582_3_plen_44_part_01
MTSGVVSEKTDANVTQNLPLLFEPILLQISALRVTRLVIQVPCP